MNLTGKIKPTVVVLISMMGIASVLLFQVYYLRDTYRQVERQIIEKTSNVLSSSILKQEVQTIGKTTASVPNQKASAEDHSGLPQIPANINVLVFDKDSAGISNQKLAKKIKALSSKFGQVNDSALYRMVKAGLKDENLEVFLLTESSSGKWLVPESINYTKMFRGPKASALFNKSKTYTILFNNLSWFIIQKMWLTIIYSVIVSLLSIGAIFFLNTNLRENSRLLAFKKAFMRNMAHELKTPLSTLVATSELLSTDLVLGDQKRVTKYISYIRSELSRLTDMVEEILTHSEWEMRGIQLNLQKFNLSAVLENAVSRYSSALKEYDPSYSQYCQQLDASGKRLTLHCKIDDDIYIHGDASHLANVFSNLIENAIKYQSQENPYLKVSAEKEQKSITILFEDNGIGIGKEYRQSIFEPFFRTPDPSVELIKGYGLGLSYVKEIVLLHKGSISVHSSTVKTGSIFKIRIPHEIY